MKHWFSGSEKCRTRFKLGLSCLDLTTGIKRPLSSECMMTGIRAFDHREEVAKLTEVHVSYTVFFPSMSEPFEEGSTSLASPKVSRTSEVQIKSMATWNGGKYCQVLLTAFRSDCPPLAPTTSHQDVMLTCSKTQRFDIQREGSLSWIHNQSGVGIRDGVRVWVFTCFKCRRVREWELLRGSEVKDGRTERTRRRVGGWQWAGQRLNRRRCTDSNVARWSFTGFTFLPW